MKYPRQPGRISRAVDWRCLILLAVGWHAMDWQLAQAQSADRLVAEASGPKQLIPVRMPGEFEAQGAIMLSINDWMPHHFGILSDLAAKTEGHTKLLIFYQDVEQVAPVIRHFESEGISGANLVFSQMPLDTIWLRDFGPRIAESPVGPIAIDFFYEGTRPKDDAFPKQWAKAAGTRLRTVRWTVQGGNLLFNGQGIGVTSERIFKDNHIEFPARFRPPNPRAEARRMVTSEFKRACNLTELVVLEPLQNEITRHVDMFLTFVAPDHAIMGWVHPHQDPVNSQILDRNAKRLQQVRVGDRQMKVTRVQFSPRRGQEWSSFTNIILANDLVLLPVFRTDSPQLIAAARKTYENAIPGCTVKTVHLDSMKSLQGSLHCLSMHLPAFAPLPVERHSFESIRARIFPR